MGASRHSLLALLSYAILAILGNQEPFSVTDDELPPILRVTLEDWTALNRSVHGRLHVGHPFSKACFSRFEGREQEVNQTTCQLVRDQYLNTAFRTSHPSAHINTQWETCQPHARGCLLDHENINSTLPTEPGKECYMGSVSNYYINVGSSEDVQIALAFSHKNRIPLVIKATGHDYKGRSSAPNSLSLWLHNLKDITYQEDFTPSCPASWPERLATTKAVTLAAGVQWMEVYDVAEKHNITIVGGAGKTVGVIGGWLQAGGHSALSNTFGLGVDRVLEFTVVTPDGILRTANQCQNQDLFWALRGGGGGTFGVVLSATVMAAPEVNLQVILVQFPLDLRVPESFRSGLFNESVTFDHDSLTLTRSLFSLILKRSLQWAEDGWGGYITANSALYINPVLVKKTAEDSMEPLADWAKRLRDGLDEEAKKQVLLIQGEFGSWTRFFRIFADDNAANVAEPIALSSRLIPNSLLNTPYSRDTLLEALVAAERISPGIRLLKTTPFSYRPSSPHASSVHPAWRSSIFHVTNSASWKWDTSVEEVKEKYQTVKKSMEKLRDISGKAAYVNEADVYEDDWKETFYGANYERLLEIKKKYDPEVMLDCWQCVGWNRHSPRYSCYVNLSDEDS